MDPSSPAALVVVTDKENVLPLHAAHLFNQGGAASPSINELRKKPMANAMMTEFADGEGPPAEAKAATDDRPLAERLGDKNWKARKSAKEELAQTFDEAESGDAPVFAEYGACVRVLTIVWHEARTPGFVLCAAILSMVDPVGSRPRCMSVRTFTTARPPPSPSRRVRARSYDKPHDKATR